MNCMRRKNTRLIPRQARCSLSCPPRLVVGSVSHIILSLSFTRHAYLLSALPFLPLLPTLSELAARMIQKLNDRRGGTSPSPSPHRECTSHHAEGSESWGSWCNRRFAFLVDIRFSCHGRSPTGFTPWRLPKSPFEHGCAALGIKYANPVLLGSLHS